MPKSFRPSWPAYLSTLCLALGTAASPAQAGEVTVAAAASLKDALEVLKPEVEKAMPGTRISISTGASGTLQQQIVQGAPLDIFISAAPGPMDELMKEKYLSEGSRSSLLTNEIVLIVPKASRAKGKDLAALKGPEFKRIAMGEPRTVPAGDYAFQILKTLKLESVLKPKLVFAKDVRQVLSYVERGEADAGFVYSSDLKAKNAAGVRTFAKAPKNSHSPILYEIALVERLIGKASTESKQEAKGVVDFLRGKVAAKTWKTFGFTIPAVPPAKKGP